MSLKPPISPTSTLETFAGVAGDLDAVTDRVTALETAGDTTFTRKTRQVVNLQNYTTLDGTTDNTVAVNDLIADMSSLGSANRKRRIEVGDGAGLILQTKSINMASNVDLDLDSCHVKKLQGSNIVTEGSLLRAPETDAGGGNYYGTYSNIRVAGGNWDCNGIDTNVSHIIRMYFVEGLELDGLHLLNYWPTSAKWGITFGGRNGLVTGCKIRGGTAVQCDGLHLFHGSDWTITDYDVESGDDAVAIGGEPGGYLTVPDHIRGVAIGPGTVKSTRGYGLSIYSQTPGAFTKLEVEDVTCRGLVGRAGILRNGGARVYDISSTTFDYIRNIDVDATLSVGGASHDGTNPILFHADGVENLRARISGQFVTAPAPFKAAHLRRLNDPDVEVTWVDDGLVHPLDKLVVTATAGSTRVVCGPRRGVQMPTLASATTLLLRGNCDVYKISGTTTIDTITATDCECREITLVFTGTAAVTEAGNIKLSAAFTASADDVMTLVCDGTSWFEKSRSVN